MHLGKTQFGHIALWTVLLLVAAIGWWMMRSSANRLRVVLASERKSQELVTEIKRLRDRPGFAALSVDSPQTITERAEQASQQADLLPSALVRIEPQSAVRLGDSPYRVRPTRMELSQVTLEQVIKFVHGMIDESQGTTVRDLRLAASDASGEAPELWTAEIVLTQLIFAPISR